MGENRKNVGDFPKNMGDFLKNVGDFLRNVGDSFSPAFHPTSHSLFIILRPSKREGKIYYRFINISALSRAREGEEKQLRLRYVHTEVYNALARARRQQKERAAESQKKSNRL